MKTDQINLINIDSKIKGTVEFTEYTRFEGHLTGTLIGAAHSELVIGENGTIEGEIVGDTITIDGYVRGDIKATTKVKISVTGRVIGEIQSPSVEFEFGSYFDGKCSMGKSVPTPKPIAQKSIKPGMKV